MLQKFFATGILLSIFSASLAQDTTAVEQKQTGTTITGSADVYYRYNFQKAKSDNAYNSITSFTQSHNTFSLGMASVKFEHKTPKVGVVVDLGFGRRAQEFSYNDDGILAAIKQLYVSYSPSEALKFTAGTWATHVGYELVDPYLNRNYSMSYMFTFGPFHHTGIKAELTKGKHGFMLGVANPTDYRMVSDEQINKKAVLAQYSFAASDNFKLYLNYVGGQSPDSTKSHQFDVVIASKLGDKFGIGANGTYNSSKFRMFNKYSSAMEWYGAAVYLNVDPQPWFGLTLRSEYFKDKQNKIFAVPSGNVFANTLSANFKVHSFVFIPELRVDNASQSIFTDKNGVGKSTTTSFLVAAIYQF